MSKNNNNNNTDDDDDDDDADGKKKKKKKVHLICTWPRAREACARLRECRLLALDMEGAPLGVRTSLLQLAVSPDEIYLFDVLRLGQHRLFDAAHLLPVLTDPRTLKLCYDGRGDGGALFHCHGVRPFGLYDLQIVYTSLFQAPGDRFLKGLHRAVTQLLPPGDAEIDAFAERKRALRASQPAVWLQRPLPPAALAYAAADVAHLFAMHRLWSPFFAERAVLDATAARIMAAPSRAQEAHCVDFAPLRARRLCFVYRRDGGAGDDNKDAAPRLPLAIAST